MFATLFVGILATSSMGQINFPVTGNAQCKKQFTDGMLALHSFMYQRAHEAFVRAAKADPGCAMAHWGDAMTNNHPLWGEEDLAAGRAALVRASPSARPRGSHLASLRSARRKVTAIPSRGCVRGWPRRRRCTRIFPATTRWRWSTRSRSSAPPSTPPT
jgi:hypothetical protein